MWRKSLEKQGRKATAEEVKQGVEITEKMFGDKFRRLLLENSILKHEKEIHKLISMVPQPPGEDLPPGTSEKMLNDFKTRTNIALPDEFCEWLRITNGPCIGPGGFLGIKSDRLFWDMEDCLARHPKWSELKWLPVAGDACGNYYLMATRQEFGPGYPIFFVDHELDFNTPAYIVASSIGDFLRFILQDELPDIYGRYWPFNKERVVAEDPDFLCCHGLPLPWEEN